MVFDTIREVEDYYKQNNPQKHNILYNQFYEKVESHPSFKNHLKSTEGYGESPFSWNWNLIIKEMPNDFKFIEIGVYKGRILSLVQLIANEQNKKCQIFGVTPLSNVGDKYSGYDNDDYYEAIKRGYQRCGLSLENTKIIHGLSQDEKVLKEVSDNGLYDILFIDGSHDYEVVVQDIIEYIPMLKKGGYLVMDDSSLYIDNPGGIFKGHPDVGRAIIDILDKDDRMEELYAIGHNRVWRKKSIKTALLLAGEMRSFENSELQQKNSENIYQELETDIFISTWLKKGTSYQHNLTPIEKEYSNQVVHHSLFKKIYKSNLKKSEIEIFDEWIQKQDSYKKNIFENGFEWEGMKIKGTVIPELYKIKRANELKKEYEKENHFRYDIVIRSRPDIIFKQKIKPEYLEKINKIIHFNDPPHFYLNRIFTLFYFSNSNNMDILSSSFDVLQSLIEDPFHNGLHPFDVNRIVRVMAHRKNILVEDLKQQICHIFV